MMNLRNERPHRFTDDPDRDAAPSSPTDSAPLAAERFRREVDRITRKMDRVVVGQPPSEQSKGPLRLLGASIILLTLITMLGIIMRDRQAAADRRSDKVPATLQLHPDRRPVATPPATVPSQPSQPARADAAPENESRFPAKQELPAAAAPPQQTERTSRTYARSHDPGANAGSPQPAAAAASTSADDEEPDIDKTIAFYEPVNRQSTSGSFDVRSASSGRSIHRSGTPRPDAAQSGSRTGKRGLVKAIAALADNSGGTLDKVMEHNGNYYKIRLTLPAGRLEPFKKSLADNSTIATLSVTTESVSGGNSVVILDLHTR